MISSYQQLSYIYNGQNLEITYKRDLLDQQEQQLVQKIEYFKPTEVKFSAQKEQFNSNLDQIFLISNEIACKPEQQLAFPVQKEQLHSQLDLILWISNEIACKSCFKIILENKKTKNENLNQNQYAFYISYRTFNYDADINQNVLRNIIQVFQQLFKKIIILMKDAEEATFLTESCLNEEEIEPFDIKTQFSQYLEPMLIEAEEFILQQI